MQHPLLIEEEYHNSLYQCLNVLHHCALFHEQGMSTKVEVEKRVFPVSDSAQSVWDALVAYMHAGNGCAFLSLQRWRT